MPKIAEESIRLVAESNDIVEVIGSYLPLKRSGSALKGLCPFHKEKTPSFTVSPARQSFHCFGCGAGGGVIRFVMDYEQLPFGEAVRKLAQRAGVPLIEEAGGTDAGPSRQERTRLLEIHRVAADWFHLLLRRDPTAHAARSYLHNREINKEIASRWRLGYAPADGRILIDKLLEAGFREGEMVLSGLAGKDEGSGRLYARFRDRVMIPIHNDYGEIVGFSGRVLDPAAHPAKYVNSPETPIFTKGRLLFGLHHTKRALIEARCAIVCEGQFDLITACERGVPNVVAPQGTAFTPQQANLLKRFVDSVVLCFDADAAGQKAAESSLPPLLTQGLTVRVLTLPPGEDPDSLIRREGGPAFLDRAQESRDIFEELIQRAQVSGGLATPAGVGATARRLAGFLRLLPDVVAREKATQLVAQRLQIGPQRLLDLMRQNRYEPDTSAPEIEDARPSAPAPQPLPEACAFLCCQVLASSAAADWLREQREPPLSELGEGWETLDALLQAGGTGKTEPAWAAFLATCSPELQSTVAALAQRQAAADPLKATQSTWAGLRRQHLLSRLEKLKARLLTPGLPAQELLHGQKELLDLQKKLQELPTLFPVE